MRRFASVVAGAIVCTLAIGISRVASQVTLPVPRLVPGTVSDELARVKHAFIYCYSETDTSASTGAALRSLASLHTAYAPEDEILVAVYEATSTKQRKKEAKKALKCKSKQLPVFKYINVASGSRHTYSGGLSSSSALQEFVELHTRVPPFPESRALKKHEPLWRVMMDVDVLAGTYLDAAPEARAGSMDAILALSDKLASVPFGAEHSDFMTKAVDTHRQVVSNGWGRDEIRKEIERLTALSNNKHLNAKKKADVTARLESYRPYVEKIPKIVHFIKTDGNPANFKAIHFLAVMSAHYWIKPDKIVFHTTVDINSPYWDRAKKYVTVEKETQIPARAPNGVPIEYAAHQSDFLRLNYLIRDGGIYMDWDVISTAPIDDLLYSPVVFGAEKKIINYKEALGVAWMAARPGSPWLKRFLIQMGEQFKGKECYTCASVQLAKTLSIQYPAGLRVLNYTSFYHPGWELDGVRRLCEPDQYHKDGTNPLKAGYFYAMHLFESHENFQRYIKRIDLEWLRSTDTHFGALMRPMLDEDDRLERKQKKRR